MQVDICVMADKRRLPLRDAAVFGGVLGLVGDDGSGANLVGAAEFGLGEIGGELQAHQLFVGVDGEGGDVGFGDCVAGTA